MPALWIVLPGNSNPPGYSLDTIYIKQWRRRPLTAAAHQESRPTNAYRISGGSPDLGHSCFACPDNGKMSLLPGVKVVAVPWVGLVTVRITIDWSRWKWIAQAPRKPAVACF